MAKNYTHLTLEERVTIKVLRMERHSKRAIARAINRSVSTVTRELRRNVNPHTKHYSVEEAQRKARLRRKRLCKPCKMDDAAIAGYVKAHLSEDWSPQQIAGRMRFVEKLPRSKRISHQSIYAWIRDERSTGGLWHKHLRRSDKHHKHAGKSGCGKIPYAVSIDKRPASVLSKRYVGDWEADTIQGMQGGGYLVTLVERKTQYTILGKLSRKESRALNDVVLERFRRDSFLPARTITMDNGLEFAGHMEVGCVLGCGMYFAHPYSPHERGLNENTNRLLRQYFPKKTNLLTVSEKRVMEVERRLNDRPRKTLDYRTPAEVLKRLLRRRCVALEI